MEGIGKWIDVLHKETFDYTGSVTVSSYSLTEIVFYTRTFVTEVPYKMCEVLVTIPFTGNDIGDHRCRIIAYLDAEPIYDGTMYSAARWTLEPLTIFARKIDLVQGHHRFRIYANVDGGTLNIPHFNSDLSECKVSPTLFGKMLITGFR